MDSQVRYRSQGSAPLPDSPCRGRRLVPSSSRGGSGRGKPRFPAPLRGGEPLQQPGSADAHAAQHVARPCAAGNRCSNPLQSPAARCGSCKGPPDGGEVQPPPRARSTPVENPDPPPCSRQPSMRLAPHTDGMNILLGRAAPSQTLPREEVWGNPVSPYPLLEGQALPRAGAWGNPVSPHPCSSSLCSRQAPCAGRTPPDANGPGARAARPRRVSAGKLPALPAYVHISRPCGSAAHEQDEHRFFLGGLRPPKPSHREGYGETRFPHTPLRELMFTLAPQTRSSRARGSSGRCPGE